MADNPDMQRMQEEAMQRAREMQRRSVIPPQQSQQPAATPEPNERGHQQNIRNRVPQAPNQRQSQAQPQGQQPSPRPGAAQHNTSQPTAQPPAPIPVPEEDTQSLSPLPSMLESLFQDHDKTLILMLLLLIGTGEGKNHEITLALLHMLM